jgi:hypothetical protein
VEAGHNKTDHGLPGPKGLGVQRDQGKDHPMSQKMDAETENEKEHTSHLKTVLPNFPYALDLPF